MKTMKATVFHGANDIRVEEVSRPHAGIGEAVIRVRLTTICGTDLHIVRGESPVKPGLIIGHEPVGFIEELGPGVTGYEIGDRVLVGAVTPCGQCRACLSGHLSQCGRFDPTPLITHRFSLEEIPQAYQLFGDRSDGVLKVAIKP